MKRVLIINGHPFSESFCTEIAAAYKKGVDQAGAECKLVNISDLQFDPVLHFGYNKHTELEPDLIQVQKDIKEADHLVFVYPNWWGTFPALLKGFIDRVFLPKFAFKYRQNSQFIDKLLKGRSARLIITMDTPLWYNWLMYSNPGHKAMKKATLKFCGINPVRITSFSPIRSSSSIQRKKWLSKVENLGKKLR
jgi:putative NADPH-quinone reductase